MKTVVDVLWYCWIASGIAFIFLLGCQGYEAYSEAQLLKQLGKDETERFLANQGQAEISLINIERVLVLDGNINRKSIEKAKHYYQAIPWQIRKQFAEDGWKLVITDKDISSVYYNGPIKGELAGLTDTNTKSIYIHEKRHHIRKAFLHEFGHYLDYQNDFISGSDKLRTYFQREKSVFDRKWKPDTHAMSNAAEFFAESFQQFVLDPKTCKTHQPLTYRFIAQLMKETL